MKRIYCPQCGGHDIQRESGGTLHCVYCGNRYFPETPEEKASVIQNSKKKVLFITIGAASIFIIILIALFLWKPSQGLLTFSNESTEAKGKAIPLTNSSQGDIEPEKKAAADLIKLTPVPDSIGNIYFIGFIRNTGETVIKPVAELALYNSSGKKVAVATGYAPRSYLIPGEETPVSILVSKAPPYSDIKITPNLEHPGYYSLRPKLSFNELKLKRPKTSWDYYEITGNAKNSDTFEGTYVQIIAVLIDGDGRPVGFSSSFLGQKTLTPGDSAPFRITIHTVAGKPIKFILDYSSLSKVRGKD